MARARVGYRDKGENYLMKKRTIAALVVLAFLVPACGSWRAPAASSGAAPAAPPVAPEVAAPMPASTPPPVEPAAASTVRDNVSGLVMQFGFSPDSQSQAESIAYCASLPLAGGGWRLPTKDELETVYANRRALEPTDEDEFFWSSSSVAGSPSNGWHVGFSGGLAYYDGATATTVRARCVR